MRFAAEMVGPLASGHRGTVSGNWGGNNCGHPWKVAELRISVLQHPDMSGKVAAVAQCGDQGTIQDSGRVLCLHVCACAQCLFGRMVNIFCFITL